MQETSSPEQSSVSLLTSMETEDSSPDLLELMTEEWEEAEEPPTDPEDDTVPPRR